MLDLTSAPILRRMTDPRAFICSPLRWAIIEQQDILAEIARAHWFARIITARGLVAESPLSSGEPALSLRRTATQMTPK